MNDTTRFALPPLGAAVGGVVVTGTGLALTTAAASGVETGEGLSLGGAAVVLLGSLAAVGLGGLVWLSMLVAAARRLFPRGARLTPVLWSVSAVFVVALLAAAFESLGAAAEGMPVIVAVALAELLVPPALFVLLGRRMPPTPLKEWYLPPE